jgi:hypothetical protein
MAFLLYSIDAAGKWHSERPIVLSRVLSAHARTVVPTPRPRSWWEYQWVRSEHELVKDLCSELGLPAKNYSTVIDLKPKETKSVSLHRVEKIWGVTTPTWTPIALRLSGLFVDEAVSDAESFKGTFKPKRYGDEHTGIHEFLYFRHDGGVDSAWNWGRVGSVNGALLWPSIFDYFVSEIRREMRRSHAS